MRLTRTSSARPVQKPHFLRKNTRVRSRTVDAARMQLCAPAAGGVIRRRPKGEGRSFEGRPSTLVHQSPVRPQRAPTVNTHGAGRRSLEGA